MNNPTPPEDRGVGTYSNEYPGIFAVHISELALVIFFLFDVWRNLNPQTIRFTWRNKSLKIQCRLDFFLISKDLGNLAIACKILNAPETDHSAIFLHLKSDELKQDESPGFFLTTLF